MKVCTVISTRPDIIRLSKIIKKCDKYFKHTVVYTNQNYDKNLSDIFLDEFDIKPDYILDNKENKRGIDFIGHVIPLLKETFEKIQPDLILFLGDVNGALATSIVAKRMGITQFHLEAGSRCFDNKRVPEEINRLQIDSIADWHLCYTRKAEMHLLREGKHPSKIVVVGNPLVEVLQEVILKNNYDDEEYILSTIHRKENIDDKNRLTKIMNKLNDLQYKVKLSNHPSLKAKLQEYELTGFDNIEFFTPNNFNDFVNIEYNAKCVITDSGSAPEENYILGTPCVLLRYSTERPELRENNSMTLCSNINNLKNKVSIVMNERNQKITIPEYHDETSSIVIKLLENLNE